MHRITVYQLHDHPEPPKVRKLAGVEWTLTEMRVFCCASTVLCLSCCIEVVGVGLHGRAVFMPSNEQYDIWGNWIPRSAPTHAKMF